VLGGSTDLEWLRRNIFSDSFAGRTAASAFLARVQALVPAPHLPHARTFWVWPLYALPNEAQVGLKDNTLLSLAWSLGADAGAGAARWARSWRLGRGGLFKRRARGRNDSALGLICVRHPEPGV